MTLLLGQMATGCELMVRVSRLADWVGEGRAVTPKGVLRPADVPAAAAALGVDVPARIRTAADVESINRPWVAAQAMGLVGVTGNRAVATAADCPSDPLARWWLAVAAVLRAESHDDRRRGAAVLCRILLTVLGFDPPPAPAELEDAVHDQLHSVDYQGANAVYVAFRRGIMPVDAAMELLAEIGAVDEQGRMTPLGEWMRERLVAEAPPPVTPELSAPDLLARLARLPDDEVWRQAGRWLSGRDDRKAADELLAAAAGAAPPERIVAVDVVAGLGGPAMSSWHRALAEPALARHARSVLADLADLEDPPEPDDADRRWLAVEYALAALAVDGPDEAYHLLRDMDADAMVAVAGSDHPGAATLRQALADLVAAGGPPVATYQLKISLRRFRPPVWRRVRVPATTTLGVLHEVIQVLFDWDDDHLHVFTVEGRNYSDPFVQVDGCADESRVRVGKLLTRAGDSMRYVYDLGDNWDHQITLERIIEPAARAGGDPVCVGGQGDAPVEDWSPDCGREPTPFNLAATNRALTRRDAG